MIKLINGEALQEMSKLEDNSIDAIMCDPPYGTTACSWDQIIPLDKMWKQLTRIIKPNGAINLIAGQPFTSVLIASNLKDFKYNWYWEKERLTNVLQVKRRAGKTVEEVCVFYKKQCTYNPQMQPRQHGKISNKVKNGRIGKLLDSSGKVPINYVDTGFRYPTQVLKISRDTLKKGMNLHPTQKPEKLMEFLVKTYTNEGDLVLDFTMGSGTTGVACERLNRNFIGIELDKEFYDEADKRLFKRYSFGSIGS